MLSKEQMRDTIEKGGSVLHKGKLITRIDQLAKVEGTQAEKDAEIANLESRLAELKGATKATEEKSSESDSLDDTAAELKKHTRAELVAKAQAEGVEVGEDATKAEIIDKLLAKK